MLEGIVNKYLFVVPACGNKAGGCHKMRNCLLAAKGLAETGNVVRLVLDNSVVLPLESWETEGQVTISDSGCGAESAGAEGENVFRNYMDEGYAVIRF